MIILFTFPTIGIFFLSQPRESDFVEPNSKCIKDNDGKIFQTLFGETGQRLMFFIVPSYSKAAMAEGMVALRRFLDRTVMVLSSSKTVGVILTEYSSSRSRSSA